MMATQRAPAALALVATLLGAASAAGVDPTAPRPHLILVLGDDREPAPAQPPPPRIQLISAAAG